MDFSRAWEIIEKHNYGKENLSEEEKKTLHEEALIFLAENDEEDKVVSVFNLGMYYLESEQYDLALRQFEIGAELESELSMEQAGRIHYFGLTENASRQKAFDYLKAADDLDWDNSSYLLADMYKNGDCCVKDLDVYEEIIQRLQKRSYLNGSNLPHSPEVLLRLAEIWIRDDKKEAAYALLVQAEDRCKRRISRNNSKHTPLEYIDTLLTIQNLLFEDSSYFEVISILDLFFAEQHAIENEISFFYDGYEYQIILNSEKHTCEFMGRTYFNVRELMDFGEVGGKKLRSMSEDPLCTLKWKVMEPRKYKETDFRLFDQNFCVVSMDRHPEFGNMGFPLDDSYSMLLCYGYIDHNEGMTMIALDAAKKTEQDFQFLNVTMKNKSLIRIRVISDCEIYVLENAAGNLKEKYSDMIENLNAYNLSNEIVKTRGFSFLDGCRHPENPDRIQVYLVDNENELVEKCWVILEGFVDTEEEFYFIGKLANEPWQGLGYHKGDMIHFEVAETKSDAYICYCNTSLWDDAE